MEAIYQIGKEIGDLAARVGALEASECNCKKKKARSSKRVPKAQQAILADVRDKHPEIIAGFNDVLKKLKLSDRVKVGGINLVDADVGVDDEDICCMCCELDGQSGWTYCCDYYNCSSCC